MDWRYIFLFLCFICYLPSSMASEESEIQRKVPVHLKEAVLRHPEPGKGLFFQIRGLQSMKTKTEVEGKPSSNSHGQDTRIANSETEASIGFELPTGAPHENPITNNTMPANQARNSTDPRYPSPVMDKIGEIDRKNETGSTPTADEKDAKGNTTNATDSVTDQGEIDPVDDVDKANDNISETNTHKPVKKCEGNYCEDPKKLISACLSTPGDRAYKLSLFVTYKGDPNVLIKVMAPEFLKAEPVEVSLSKGKSEVIQFSFDSNHVMDLESIQNKTIVLTSVYGNCDIQIPTEYLLEERPRMLPSVDPKMAGYLLVFVLIISCAGVWLCYKCHGRKQAGEVKYENLEMNGIGHAAPKERVEEASGSWDEVWDEDWEDPEAAKPSSRLGQSLSSRGMAVRRGTKDGWDNSWED